MNNPSTIENGSRPRLVFIFVNGILTRPGDSRNWNLRAVNWIHLNTEDRAVMLEYFCTPIGRAFGQKHRAEKLAALVEEYLGAGYACVLVGHSNGTAVILQALALMNWPHIHALHLVSAACEEDFETNGLNAALGSGAIGQVHVWMSGADTALHIAKCRLGKFLGYGTLGLDGPKRLTPEAADKTKVTIWPTRDHSDCFKPYCFAETMRGFVPG